ncbi:MAG TPA: DegT/DnrJ/EryC1/StrS family aminotransferase [Fibrobacteria bacterium]|nr:DegT/DnrJ/EryC1/StrS family aminotransferase [Fibrobacteria bacterium]
MAINVFVPSFHVDEILPLIRECLEKGWTGLGFKTVEFEEAWKTYSGLAHAHFLASSTVGLHLAVHALKLSRGWKDGDEIITTPLTFVSTNHAILYEDLKPVFADIDDSLCLDPASVEAKITPKTRAVMFVGIGGNIGKYPAIVDLCRKRGLDLILDAAHMAGTRVGGRHVGHDADCTIFSYQAVKNLPTSDSGMICFRDPVLDKLARELSWLGINKDTFQRSQGGSYKWRYDVPHVGFKYHGNSIQASIGLVQLKYLDQDNDRRRAIAALYDSLLAGLPEVKRVEHSPECKSSRHLYQIRVKHRDRIMAHFHSKDIYPGVHYVDNTEYAPYAEARGTCPRAGEISEELITLPIHLRLTDQDCRTVAAVLLEGIAKHA